MGTPTIPNGKEHFFPIIYEGNGAGQRVGKFVPFTDNGTIANSVIFNDGDTAYLDRTFGSGNQKIWTMSFWVKRCTLGAGQRIISRRTGGGSTTATMGFNSSNEFNFYDPSNGGELITNRTFEDTSKFYHFLIRYEASNSTQEDTIQIYVDGERQTFQSAVSITDTNGNFNANVVHAIGKYQYNNSEYFDGYLAEVNWIDGTNYGPETFGVTDTSTGRWVPKTLTGITYGTNGFRLTFQNNSAIANLGYDYQTSDRSTTNDFSVTNLATTDQTTDSPTQNHFTFSANDQGSTGSALAGTAVLEEGNLRISAGSNPSNWDQYRTGKSISGGKYYLEVKLTSYNTQSLIGCISKLQNIKSSTNQFYDFQFGWGYTASDGKIENNNSGQSTYGSARSQGDVIGIAVDMDNGNLWFSENGVYPNSGNPATGANPAFTNLKIANQDGGLSFIEARGYSGYNDWNFGQKSFTHTPPTGFVALQQDNLPETAKGITGMGWIKNRDASDSHQLYDSSRGKQLVLTSDTTTAEATVADGLQKFLKGGQSIEDDVSINTSGESFVSWNWVANAGTSVTNDASATGVGDIDSVYQANTTAGFSIVTYTGTGSAGGIAHGLGAIPRWVMTKSRSNDTSDGFTVLHGSTGTDFYDLSKNNAGNSNTVVWNAVPTSTVFNVGTATGTNNSGYTYLAYCWAEIEGFSKFGSYIGNGNANGTFVYTGFRPAWVMTKATSGSRDWNIYDSTRSLINPTGHILASNLNYAESSVYSSAKVIDILSNGYKLRGSNSNTNASGVTFIYMAFAEHPFIGDGTSPVTAR